MPILVYFHPESMTREQYDGIMDDLRAEGKFEPEGLLTHVCFEDAGTFCVCDTWESRDHFMRFTETLMPLIEKQGVGGAEPHIFDIHADYTRERGYRVCDAAGV